MGNIPFSLSQIRITQIWFTHIFHNLVFIDKRERAFIYDATLDNVVRLISMQAFIGIGLSASRLT